MATMQEILKDTESFVMSKRASFKTKSAIAGEDPASMPGSENDKPAPSVSADPEIKDTTMGPAETREEAGKGDPDTLTGGHATGAEEGAEPVEKKPLDSDDANVDATAKMANDILSSIHAWQGKAAAKPAVVKAAAAPVAAKPAVKAAAKAAAQAPVKAAGTGLNVELTESVLAKMAAIALSYDEGVTFMHDVLQKHAGEAAADETIDFIAQQNLEAEKQAAEAQGYQDAQAAALQAAYQAGIKAASAKPLTREEQLYKLGQALADGSIADVMGALPAGDMGALPAGDMGAAPEGVPAEAMMGGEMPAEELPAEGGEEDYTVEDLAAALDVLVSEGDIDENTAQQVLESVVSGEEGGAPVEGAPAEEPPAEAPPAEEPPAEEPAKEASRKQ